MMRLPAALILLTLVGAFANPAARAQTACEPLPEPSVPPREAVIGQAPEDDESEAENVIIVEGTYGPPAGDPMERLNAESYRIVQDIDRALIEPVAYAYRDGLPDPLRDGLGNVVRNLGEPKNALNFLLQGKVGKAFETMGRLAINSTLGLGGLFDIAKKPGIGLPYRRNGLANTLGFYGVGPGPYLYLPISGSTTARDLIGNTLDQALLPLAVGRPFNRPAFGISYFVVSGLDSRLAFDEELARIRATDDPYATQRDLYLATRRREIAELRGRPLPEDPMPAEDAPDPDPELQPVPGLETAPAAPDGEDATEPTFPLAERALLSVPRTHPD